MFQLRSFIHQRLFAAAEEILGEVEKTITLALCDSLRLDPDSLLKIKATEPPLTNTTAAAVPREETSTQPLIQEEWNLDTPEASGLSQTITDTGNSSGNQCSVHINFKVKEEQEEELVDDGQIQEIILHSPESVKEEKDQPETQTYNELQAVSSDFSEAESEDNSDEEWMQRKGTQKKTRRQKGKAPQRQTERGKEKVQAPLPDRESSARSQRDCRACPVCGKVFLYICPFMKHLKTHKRMSESVKELLSHLQRAQIKACKVCGKGFASRSSLRTHSKTHTGIKDFECPDCGKTFLLKEHLNRHSRTHTGEKPFHCDICGKAFTQSSSLKIHKRTHTGERPYPCETCGRQFFTLCKLNRHTNGRPGGNPYSCDVCGKNFCQKGKLVRHKGAHTLGDLEG